MSSWLSLSNRDLGDPRRWGKGNYTVTPKIFSSVQFKMVSVRSNFFPTFAFANGSNVYFITDDSVCHRQTRDSGFCLSVQFKMVSTRSEKPICAQPRLSQVSPNVAFETVPIFV